MLRNKIYISGILILISFVIHAQNLKQDLASINNAYKHAANYSVSIHINMYETHSSQKVYYNEEGIIQKKGDNTYQKFGETESVITPEYAVIIDKEEKTISYTGRKMKFKEADMAFMINADSISAFCKTFVFKKETNGWCSYDFVMKSGYPGYERIVISYDPKNWMIKKIVYYATEDDISVNDEKTKLAKARMEVSYETELKPKYIDDDFTYDRYMYKKGKTFELKPQFKGYELQVVNF